MQTRSTIIYSRVVGICRKTEIHAKSPFHSVISFKRGSLVEDHWTECGGSIVAAWSYQGKYSSPGQL